jgi:hypothetical protein
MDNLIAGNLFGAVFIEERQVRILRRGSSTALTLSYEEARRLRDFLINYSYLLGPETETEPADASGV